MLDFDISTHGVATLALNRPEALNALSSPMIDALIATLARVKEDSAVRVLLLTGRGRAFCAGADLRDPMMNVKALPEERGRRFLASADAGIHAVARLLAGLGKPKVAAVNGPAVGGGAALAFAADIVLAADTAYFQFPFTSQLGLVPDLGGSWHLARRLGPARAMATLMLGERIESRQAAEWGLIWQCVSSPELPDAASKIAHRLAAGAPRALASLPPLLADALRNDFDTQLDRERDRQAELVQTQDFIEAVMAFQEKRKPFFTGH